MDFVSNPNQRKINIPKEGQALCDENHYYLKAQKKAMFDAMKALTPTNFQVWLYLASQKKDQDFWFTPAAVTLETGIKKSSLQEGIRVLIREKYLIPRADGSNIFDFFEVPRTEEPGEEPDSINIHINPPQQEPPQPMPQEQEHFVF